MTDPTLDDIREGWVYMISDTHQTREVSRQIWRQALAAHDAEVAEKIARAIEGTLHERVIAERARHSEKGYDTAHDARHGITHLHEWAEHYADGTDEGYIKALSLLVAARALRIAREAVIR